MRRANPGTPNAGAAYPRTAATDMGPTTAATCTASLCKRLIQRKKEPNCDTQETTQFEESLCHGTLQGKMIKGMLKPVASL
jgi:hypothetical protein